MSALKNHNNLLFDYSSNLLGDPIIADIEVPAIHNGVEQVSKSFFDVDRSLPYSFRTDLGSSSSDGSQSLSSNEEKSRPVTQKSTVRSSKSQMVKKTKRKTWKKPEGKPKRPISSYNLYFQLERERILKNQPEKEYTMKDIDMIIHKNKIMDMLPQPKRKHEKSHGIIGFKEMAKMFADNWKALDPSKKQIFFDRAAVQKELYIQAVKEWESGEKKSTKQSLSKSHETIEVDFKKALPKVGEHNNGILKERMEFEGIFQNVNSAAGNAVLGEHFEESPVSVRGELSLQEVSVIVKQFQDKYNPHVANCELDFSGNEELGNKQEDSLLTFGTQFGVVSCDRQHQNSDLIIGEEKMTLQNFAHTLNIPAQWNCQDMNIQNTFEHPTVGEGFFSNNNQVNTANTFPPYIYEDENNGKTKYLNPENSITRQGHRQDISIQNISNEPMVGEVPLLQNKPPTISLYENSANNFLPYKRYCQALNIENICNKPTVGEETSLQNDPAMYVPYKNQENSANAFIFNTEKNNDGCTEYNFDSEDATIMCNGYCQDINAQSVCNNPTVGEIVLQNKSTTYIPYSNQETNTNTFPSFNTENGNNDNTEYDLSPEQDLMRQFLFLQS